MRYYIGDGDPFDGTAGDKDDGLDLWFRAKEVPAQCGDEVQGHGGAATMQDVWQSLDQLQELLDGLAHGQVMVDATAGISETIADGSAGSGHMQEQVDGGSAVVEQRGAGEWFDGAAHAVPQQEDVKGGLVDSSLQVVTQEAEAEHVKVVFRPLSDVGGSIGKVQDRPPKARARRKKGPKPQEVPDPPVLAERLLRDTQRREVSPQRHRDVLTTGMAWVASRERAAELRRKLVEVTVARDDMEVQLHRAQLAAEQAHAMAMQMAAKAEALRPP